MTGISEKIKIYISESVSIQKKQIKNDEPLFTGGVIDSLGHIKLICFIEKEFGISVKMEEITIENFDTIDRISGFVKNKIGD